MRAGRYCASLASLALVGVLLVILSYSQEWFVARSESSATEEPARADVMQQTTGTRAGQPELPESKLSTAGDHSQFKNIPATNADPNGEEDKDSGDKLKNNDGPPPEVEKRSNDVNTPKSFSNVTKSKVEDRKQVISEKESSVVTPAGRPTLAATADRESPHHFDQKQSSAKHLHKLVHLDLKGAPPKISYFERIFPYFKKWGATGLLIEYEDMFPYAGTIRILAAPNAYSPEDIKTILKLAKDNDLIVIPLVQTFGHMEFVLEHNKFKYLKENEENLCCITPLKTESLELIKTIIRQVMDLHPAVSHIHIGSDEVYELGVSRESRNYMNSHNIGKDALFFRHVKAVASFVSKTYPGVKPIMWDDMMRHVSLATLKESTLGDIVEPMVWVYTPEVLKRVEMHVWHNYAKVFPRVWLASAFKGATGIDQFVTDISYHMKNHRDWLKTIDVISKDFGEVRGIALTGWQRYHHKAVLCELLPAGLPSLAVNLNMLVHGKFDQQIHQNVSKLLDCRNTIELTLETVEHQPDCAFPGAPIYAAVLKLHHVKSITYGEQLNKPVLTPDEKRQLTQQYEALSNSYKNLEKIFQEELRRIYFEDTVKEFVATHVIPHKHHLDAIYHRSIKATEG